MLAQNQEVIVKMRLARREIPSRETGGRRNQLDNAVGAVIPWNEFVVFCHIPSSDTRVDRERRLSRGRCQIQETAE